MRRFVCYKKPSAQEIILAMKVKIWFKQNLRDCITGVIAGNKTRHTIYITHITADNWRGLLVIGASALPALNLDLVSLLSHINVLKWYL